tara:strand:- start:1789 stop:2295 length:507 start_codon:yes stop_codon:yes gene_type:complete
MLRILFQLFKTNSNNQVAVMVANVTNVMVIPLRQYLPRTRYIDLSTLTCWLFFDILKYTILVYFTAKSGSGFLSIIEYIKIVPADFIMQALSIIIYSTLFYTILLFVAPGLKSMGMDTLKALSEPALIQARKIISPAGGFDFAPAIIMLGSKCIQLSIMQFIPASYFY